MEVWERRLSCSRQRYALDGPLPNIWRQYNVPLSALGVGNSTNFTGFAIQDSAGSAESTLYLDDIQLVSAIAPTVPHMTFDARQVLRTADARWFGMNTPMWDSALETPQS